MLKILFDYRNEDWYKEANSWMKIIMDVIFPFVGIIAYVVGFIEGRFEKFIEIISKIFGGH